MFINSCFYEYMSVYMYVANTIKVKQKEYLRGRGMRSVPARAVGVMLM